MQKWEWYDSLRAQLTALSRANGISTTNIITQYCQSIESSYGRRSVILDVGCQTGTWALERGDEAEFCDVVGIDCDLSLVGLSNATTRWDNVTFQRVDISGPLPYDSECFDVIHISLVSLQIPNYRQLLERCARMLRKGGLMVITEVEVFFHSAIEGRGLGSALKTWQMAVKESLAARGISPTIAPQLAGIVQSTGILDQNMPVEEIGISCGGYSPAIGRLDISMLASSFQLIEPYLCEHGYGGQEISDLTSRCLEELADQPDAYFQRAFTVCARKVHY